MESPHRNPRKNVPFSPEDTLRIQKQLDVPVDVEHIAFRPSAQGTVAYVEGWRALHLANEVFGFSGWSSEILSLATDFVDTEGGRVTLGVSCMDIGYGSSENQRSKAAAYEKARKEAVTDAMKRALRMFGNRLGNCAYDKTFLQQVRSKSRPNSTSKPVNLATTIPPVSFVPKWQHPKSAPAPSSEMDNELVVTEERIF
ncbi:Rad52/22 double strand DNA break repair [Paramicrosporidium saccamoebae]|uniref:Rad52/22 double strand DNA break repair n=1 Tax=Paramicrosporidium saccamoebae TaxID=1246581 RepID=A0A2H9TQQ4_9FUNG|nr:Rad52/22 double strand DNA break repair [Paramicrosporidium saccamoebae]